MNKKSVEPLLEGRNAWKLGWLGFLSRAKGLTITGAITLVSMGTPWWLPSDWLNTESTLRHSTVISISALAVGLIITALIWYVKRRSIRSLDVKYYLHQLAHDVRNRQIELFKELLSKSFSQGKRRKHLELMLQEVATNIAHLFRRLTGEESIGVAIRLAHYDAKTGALVYRTYARSKGFNPQRQKHSEDIPANQGIPRYLQERNENHGILIYHDFKEAEKNKTYYRTKNDDKFPDDVKTMMVAPLNGWSMSKETMIGLLYVVSRKEGTFNAVYFDSMAFAADVTALAISNSFMAVELADKLRKEDVSHA